MIWLYLGISLVGILILIIFLNILIKPRNRTPAALAEQIIRFPERSLLDIPLFINSISAEEIGGFLKETDDEIAQRGQFEMRRKFLQVFTQLIENPSINHLKNFTDFLFDDSTKDFQSTLRWDERCNSALTFLKLMKVMCESLEVYRSPAAIRDDLKEYLEEVNKPEENDLGGTDRKIAGEWNRLLASFFWTPDQQKKKSAKSKKSKRPKKRKSKNQSKSKGKSQNILLQLFAAFYRTPDQQKKKSAGSKNSENSEKSKSKSQKELLPQSLLLSEKKLPVSLGKPERIPHLLPFQTVARDVLMQYRQIYHEQRFKKGKSVQK